MKVFITGASGFVGGFLSAHAAMQGAEIAEPGRLECDLLDPAAVRRALAKARPELIFHLAAQSSVAESWKDPAGTIRTNVEGQKNLLDAVRAECPEARVLVACSSDEYGAADSFPIREDAPLRPGSPYAESKAEQDRMAERYFKEYGVRTVRTRNFSQLGPGQDARFAAGRFARETARIEAGLAEPVLKVGNLEAVRDFVDVRDSTAAMWLALEKGRPGEAYNVCSGKGRRIAEILDHCRAKSRVKFKVEPDPALLRPSDMPKAVGDGAKLAKETGWAPKIAFEKSLDDLLDYWRKLVGEEKK